MTDSTHSIMQSAKRFFSGTMLSRVAGMLRDMMMAYVFGTQSAIAAFLVAFRLSHSMRRLFGEGALQSAFIPQFELLRKDNPQRASQFFRDLTLFLSIGLTAIITAVMIALAGFWAWGNFSAGNQEILFLTLLLMPSLLFICLFGLNASLLQCEKSYFTPGVAPVAFNVIWIAGVLSLWRFAPTEAMPYLAAWVILACICQWLITVPRTWSILKKYGVTSSWRRLFSSTQDIKTFCKPLFLGIVGVAATQVNNALDAIFARYADAEGPAFLWYALRIQQLPLALFGVALSGALLPPLTRALKNDDLVKYREFLAFAVHRTIGFMLPITAALLVMGSACIQFLYGHGDFQQHSIAGTVQCLWGYALGLIPMTLILVLAPAFYARSQPRIPAYCSVAAVVLNVILNAYFVFFCDLGAASIALATSISAWMNVALLAYALPDFSLIFTPQFNKMLIKIGATTLAATAAAFFIGELTQHYMLQMVLQAGCFLIPQSSIAIEKLKAKS